MNARFRYDSTRGAESFPDYQAVSVTSIKKPDRTLLFAEMCVDDVKSGGLGDRSADGVLEYGQDDMDKERIGFPHKTRESYVGHVAFVDGHVEQYFQPREDKSGEQNLTKWLCTGVDVNFDGARYSEIADTESEGDDEDLD